MSVDKNSIEDMTRLIRENVRVLDDELLQIRRLGNDAHRLCEQVEALAETIEYQIHKEKLKPKRFSIES